ncbi:uncharacterized protein LOC135213996 [Macrobrachium nipponense]|uniref:uncharacterized protein LOC135213996 n=1 Tax=Macrobrachium nipponense TaxID=159736 RepID=UPI0030C87E8F
MKVFLLVVLVALATADASQLKNCTPNPPVNERVDSVTSTTINISFEDPDDMSCPIIAYKTHWETALSSSITPKDAEGEGNHLYHVEITDLLPHTRYRIYITSISSDMVQSSPKILYATTD